jgi:hypothetical protein
MKQPRLVSKCNCSAQKSLLTTGIWTRDFWIRRLNLRLLCTRPTNRQIKLKITSGPKPLFFYPLCVIAGFASATTIVDIIFSIGNQGLPGGSHHVYAAGNVTSVRCARARRRRFLRRRNGRCVSLVVIVYILHHNLTITKTTTVYFICFILPTFIANKWFEQFNNDIIVQ